MRTVKEIFEGLLVEYKATPYEKPGVGKWAGRVHEGGFYGIYNLWGLIQPHSSSLKQIKIDIRKLVPLMSDEEADDLQQALNSLQFDTLYEVGVQKRLKIIQDIMRKAIARYHDDDK